MYVKSTILIALMIASLALARGITSKAEEDQAEEEDSDSKINNEEATMENELASDPAIGSTPTSQQECALAANAPTDRTSENTDRTNLLNGRSILDRIDGNKRLNIGRHLNLDRIRNGIMHATSHPSSNILQLLENFDLLRPLSDNRERLASILPNLIDPLIPPQMQYVDNTLRLMSIKNTMDDLLAKIFPNLHMLQHPTEQNNKYIQSVD